MYKRLIFIMFTVFIGANGFAFWYIDTTKCSFTESVHCCCYDGSVYVGCRTCEVPTYQITCRPGGVFGCSGGLGCVVLDEFLECFNCCEFGAAGDNWPIAYMKAP